MVIGCIDRVGAGLANVPRHLSHARPCPMIQAPRDSGLPTESLEVRSPCAADRDRDADEERVPTEEPGRARGGRGPMA